MRYPVLILLLCSLVCLGCLTACGGSSSSNNAVAKIVVTPSTFSMNKGEALQISVPAVQDSSGNAVSSSTTYLSTDFTYSSADSNLVGVSPSGLLCGGKWDANFVVCTPATNVANTTVTVAFKNKPSITTTASVYVHEKIDRVAAVPPTPTATDCVSVAGTLSLSANAYSNDSAVCARLQLPTPCEIPAATLGQFYFGSTDTNVVTIDNTKNPPVATAAAPGQAGIFAVGSDIHSPTVPFETCRITGISVVASDTKTGAAFSLDKAGTKTLNATVTDSKGTTLSTPPLTWYSTNPYAVTAAAQSPALNATITAVNSGSSAAISANCTPPTCNRGLTPLFGNIVNVTTNGTLNAPTVYAASTQSTSLVPIDTSNNTVGTAITLPRIPNSMLVSRNGGKVVFGSDEGGMMIYDPVANTTTNTVIPYVKVLATSPDGIYAFAASSTIGYIVDLSKGTASAGFSISGANSASFSPNSEFLFVSNGSSSLYVLDQSSGLKVYPVGSAISDVSSYASGAFAYLALPGGISARSTCSPTTEVDSQNAAAPQFVKAFPNGGGAVAVAMPNAVVISGTTLTQDCTAAVTETSSTFDLGLGSPTARQLAVTIDGSKAVVTSDSAKLSVIDLNAKTATAVTLGASASGSYFGGATADGKSFYVGASDGTVHRIDLTANSDAAQINPALKKSDSSVAVPDLVGVRSK